MDRSARRTLIVIVMVVAVAGWYVWQLQDTSSDTTPELQNISAVAHYVDLSGNPVSLEDFAGRVIVVNVWATWTPHSTRELPMLAEVAREFSDEVMVIALNRKETAAQVERFMRNLPPLSDVHLWIDPEDHFYHFVSGFAMPETIIFNNVGDIVYHSHGVMSGDDLRRALRSVINDPQ